MKLLIKTPILLSIVMITCFAIQSNAQNVKAPLFAPAPSKETAAELLRRPVVLCMREVDKKEAEKLKKKDPDQLKFEESYNEYFNNTMKRYFDLLFNGSKSIDLKSADEVNVLLSSRSSSVAIVKASDMTRTFQVGGKDKKQDTYSFEMMLPDKPDDAFTLSLTNGILSDADFAFVVQQINHNLKAIVAGEPVPSYNYTNNEKAGRLKQLKLIVNRQKIDNDLNLDAIKEKYKYPVELVDSLTEYENIITSQKAGYAYIIPVWSASLWGAGYAVVDAANGEIICILSAGGVSYAIGWRPAKTGDYATDMYNKKYNSIDVINFKRKYELKEGHFKYFNKLAEEAKN